MTAYLRCNLSYRVSFREQNLHMFFRSSFASFLLVCASLQVIAQVTAPKYSNDFLAIGVGARALGMGNTQTAITDDVTSAYWNPAGLNKIKSKYDASVMRASYFAGIANYDYAGLAYRIDTSSVLAASMIRFSVDDIPDTRFLYDANGQLNYNRIRFFSAADYAFALSYARKNILIPGLDLGANVKVIYRRVGDFANAWGFGLDVGAQYKWKGIKLGLMARDVTGTFNAWTVNSESLREVFAQTGNTLPSNSVEVTLPRTILGMAYRFVVKKKVGITPALDWELTFDGKRNTLIKSNLISADPRGGIEADYNNLVYVRFGVNNLQQFTDFDQSKRFRAQTNFGLGLRLKHQDKVTAQIDYALTNIGDLSGSLYSNIFSLRLGFVL
jgi:hypothetical protein